PVLRSLSSFPTRRSSDLSCARYQLRILGQRLFELIPQRLTGLFQLPYRNDLGYLRRLRSASCHLGDRPQFHQRLVWVQSSASMLHPVIPQSFPDGYLNIGGGFLHPESKLDLGGVFDSPFQSSFSLHTWR